MPESAQPNCLRYASIRSCKRIPRWMAASRRVYLSTPRTEPKSASMLRSPASASLRFDMGPAAEGKFPNGSTADKKRG